MLALVAPILTSPPPLLAQATPAPACTTVRTPQPVPTPTRPAWAGEELPLILEPVPDAALDPLIPQYLDHAIDRYVACWNAEDWATVVTGASPQFLTTALGIPHDPAAVAGLELASITMLDVSEPRLWTDGRVATEVLYQRGSQVIAERWFFLVSHGDALLDEAISLPLPPLGDRLVLGVEAAEATGPWSWRSAEPEGILPTPLIVLAVANRPPEPRTLTLRDASGAVRAYLRLPGSSQVELGLLDLPPGTYEIESAESPGFAPLRLRVGEPGA